MGFRPANVLAGLMQLYRLDIRGLFAFRTLGDVKADFLAFFQGFEAAHIDSRKMCAKVIEHNSTRSTELNRV